MVNGYCSINPLVTVVSLPMVWPIIQHYLQLHTFRRVPMQRCQPGNCERLLQAQSVLVANCVKARQSLMERSKLAKILLIYIVLIFVYYMYI